MVKELVDEGQQDRQDQGLDPRGAHRPRPARKTGHERHEHEQEKGEEIAEEDGKDDSGRPGAVEDHQGGDKEEEPEERDAVLSQPVFQPFSTSALTGHAVLLGPLWVE